MQSAIESFLVSAAHGTANAGDPPPASANWRLEDIDFGAIDKASVEADELFLLILVASSFIESGSQLYALNLIAHFEGDAEVATWLSENWEPEELQHGRALRCYVAHVWPAFDWDRAYAGFMKDYGPLCTTAKLEPRRGLEMAARCVVETGTTSLYRAIHDVVHEPVLRRLLRHISNDEIGHYKHFFRYFRRYQLKERSSRVAILGALLRRTIEIGREDTDYGLRHAYAERYSRETAPRSTPDEIRLVVNARLRNSIPLGLSSAMWLRPLQLNSNIERQFRRAFPLVARSLMVGSAAAKRLWN